MIAWVLDALVHSPWIEKITISVQNEDVFSPFPELGRLIADNDIRIAASERGPAASALRAMSDSGHAFPYLLTTADNALLTPDILQAFFHSCEARSGTDLAVGFTSEALLQAAYPDMRRTYLRFRDGGFSGCNLYGFLTARSLAAAAFWVEADRLRKRPYKLIARFGVTSLLLFALRRLTVEAALARAGSRLGLKAVPVLLPYPEAAIDVDKPADLVCVERIIAKRQARLAAAGRSGEITA